MKKITARILCSALASLMMFSSVSMPVLASDYSHVTSENSSDSVGSSNESTGGEELKKQMEDLINESKESSSESEDQASGVDDSENTADDVDNADENKEETTGDDNADESAGDEETEETALEDDAAISDITEALEEPGEEGASNEDEERELLQTGNWSYYLDEDGYAHIAGYEDSEATSLLVPKKVGGYYVVALEEGAFTALSNLASVTIPFYINNIDSDVFGSDVTIKAYHGTAAASYAAENGFAFENRSELDFADGVIDLTEIYRAHYSRIAELEFEFDRLEASYLEEGSVFYLAPSDEVPNGDIYKVITKEENGDSVTLIVERSVGKEALNSIHIDEDNLKPDWYTATYFADADDDGNYEEYSLSDMEKIGDEYLLNGFGSIEIDKDLNKPKLSYNINRELTIKDTNDVLKEKYPDGLPDRLKNFPSVKTKVKIAGEIGIEKGYSLKVDVDLLKAQINRLEFVEHEEVSYECSFSGSVTATIPIAVYTVPSPGLYEIKAEADLVFDLSGKMSLVFKTTSESGYRYVDGEFVDIRSCDTDSGFEISGAYKIYLRGKIKVKIIDIMEMSMDLSCGVKLKLSAELDDFADSAESTLSIFSELKISGTLKLFIFDWEKEYNFWPQEIVLYKSKVDTYTVKFMTGKSYANVPAQTVVKGGYATAPDTDIVYTNAAGQSVGIEGWYKDPQYREKFDFENTPIKEDTVIYGKTVSTHLVTLDYSSIELPEYTFEAPEGKKLAVDSKKKMDYKFEGWYKDSEHKDRWNIETDLVPDHDITLYANYIYQEGYNPWNDRASEGETVIKDGIVYSSEGFKYKVEGSGNDKHAVITGYEGPGGAVVVPTTVENGTVRVSLIESTALRDKTEIINLIIPNDISYRWGGMGLLKGCTNIETISLPRLSSSLFVPVETLDRVFNVLTGEIERPQKLRKVTLTGNISAIDHDAFSNWSMLEEIEYPDTVKTIRSYAFNGCTGLKKLPITENVNHIEEQAFNGCTNVKEIVITNNQITIDSGAFHDCTGIKSVSLPDDKYSLFSLFRSSDESNDTIIEKHSALKKVTLTGNIYAIGSNAFSNWTPLEEINYPETVRAIGNYAFQNCDGLKNLPLNDRIITLGNYAFADCDGITRIDIPSGVKRIGDSAFSNCSNVKKIVIPNNEITIEKKAFESITKVNELTIPSKVTLNPGVFCGCTEVEKVSISDLKFLVPSGSIYTGMKYLFGDTSENADVIIRRQAALRKVTLTGNITYIVDGAFKDWAQIEEVNYPDTVTSIGYNAFAGCDGLKTLPITENVRIIGANAFYGCNGITRIDIPSGVREIGGSAFGSCANVSKISIPNNEIRINSNAFANLPGVKELVIPNRVVLSMDVFSGCTGVERVSIPDVIFASGSSNYTGLNYLFGDNNISSNTIIARHSALRKVTLTGNITGIRDYAFMNWTQLEEIDYPDTVTNIGSSAFDNCDGLKALPITENVRTIGGAAFYDCDGISRIDIPSGVRSIGWSAFGSCTNVTKISIPNNEIRIDGGAFANLPGVKELVIPNKVVLSMDVFSGCTGVERVSIPDVIFASGSSNYTGLNYLFGDNNISSNTIIARHSALRKVTLTGSITSIRDYAFQNWTQLEEIDYPDTVTAIGSCAFYNCSSLRRTVLPAGVKTISSNAFTGCTGLEEILIYADNLDISKITFKKDADGNGITAVYGHVGSKAEEYAERNNLPFEDIDEQFAPVTYVFNNGQDDAVSYERIGELITEPAVPYYNGFTFDKWYFDEGLTVPWDFEYDLLPACGITLYGDWKANESIVRNFTYEVNADEVTITGYVGLNGYVTIPEKIAGLPVTKLGDKAFAYDKDVIAITIPRTVEEIAQNCFIESPYISSITVSSGNESFVSEDGVLYDKEKTELILFPARKQAETYTIPDTVSRIREYAFAGSELKEVVLGEGLEEIGDMAFSGCATLDKVTLSETVNAFGNFVFWNSPLVKVYGPVGNEDIEAFVAKELVDYNRYTLTFVSDGSVVSMYNIKAGEPLSDYLQDVLKSINKASYKLAQWTVEGDESKRAWNFDRDVMPQGDVTLEADWICMYSYSVTDDKATITGTGIDASDYVIPETIDGYAITEIAAGAFTGTSVESVTIPAAVTEIADGAFRSDVTIIADGDCAAADYAKAVGLDFKVRKYPVVFESNGGTPVSTRYYTKGSKITVVPRPIKDNNNFRAWYKDEFLTAKWDFDNDVMPGEELTLYAGWNRIDENIEDDVFSYETNNERLTITGYTGKSSYVEIPGAINGVPVTSIGEYAFAFNEIAGTVIIPDSVTTIDDKAFYNCHSLEKVTFGKNTEELGTAAFAGCTSLNRIDFTGTKITKIPDSCFMQAENLYFVTLSDNITEIGDSSFAGCTYLQSIELPAHLENIGRYAFFNDKVVKELTIPSAVKEIGESFVDGCTALGTINAGGNGSTYIGRDGILYRGNTLVRCPEGYDGDVNVPDDVINIGKGAFFHCTKVTAVILGKAVINVAASAFNGCRSLVSFSFAQKNKVMGISDFMFYGCSSLTSIVLPGEISSIGKSAFANCTALTRLRVGENVTFVGNTAFFGDDKLVIEAYADSAIDRYAAQEDSLKLEYIADKALAPKAPEAESVVNTTITLKATEGYEYRIEDGQWQTSNVFEGLEPAKAYTFYQRVAESPYTKASNSSEGAVIVSGKYKGRTVKTPVVREVTSSSVTVVELAGCEYSIDGVNFSSEPEITNLRANREYTLYQRAAETQDTEAGKAAYVTFRTPVHTGTCTVIFELDGGTLKGYDDSTAFATCETGDFVADPGEPVRKGYRFEGWFYGSELFDFTEPVDNDMTLVAGWTVRQQVQMPYSNIDGSAPVDRNTGVYLATGTIDARIYYTTDGSEPTVDSEHYEMPIIVTRDMTIRAIAVKEGSADSEVMTLTLAVKNAADLGDVAEEDIPASGDAGESPEERIPEKLWVAGLISEMPYTGSAITQQIRVYDHKTLLTEKKDYKLTYRNNTRVGTATVTVTGTGSYSGSLKLEFAITAPDIGDDTAFSAEDIYVSYNKKAQKPSAVLFHGGKKLKSGTDYTASWTNEKGEQGKGFTAAGDYEITLTGKGNYKGTRTLFFHVTESTLIGKVKLNKISAEQYTGDAVHPEIVLTDKKYTLVEGEDYIVEWPSDCTSVGNVTLLIKGIGKYAGTRSATFAIKGTALKSAAVTGIASSYGYEGEAVEPAGPEDDNTAPGVALLTATDSRTKGKISLIKGIDYTVSYRNNDKAGTATVVFTGIGRYTGSVSKTFRIAAYNLSRDVDNITAVYEKTDAYVKNGVKPSVSVYFRGMPLTEGTDYTLTYANNNAVTGESTKKLPSITIKGKGNFTGKYKTLNFTITRQDISGMNISVSDKVYVNKAKAYVSAPVITDASSPYAKLVAGKDYDKKLTYRYDEDTVVTQVVKRETVSYERHKGDEVMDGDILPAGAVVRVEAVGIGCYEGTLTGCYKIMKSDIAKATVKVRDQVYTGREIEPGKDQIISITIGKTTLSRDDYIIESYTDNVKVGTATMIIRGRGIYGGTRKVTFKIVKKVLAN